jgi:predicted O-methyltransferase YrrM
MLAGREGAGNGRKAVIATVRTVPVQPANSSERVCLRESRAVLRRFDSRQKAKRADEVLWGPMSTRTLTIDEKLYDYLLAVSVREPRVLSDLREETARLPEGGMQISPEQGQLMRLLIETLGARRCLEVGVFTGYSSISVALALPPGGKLVACDVSEEFTSIARRYWRQAGVEDRIELRLGPALSTLDELIGAGQAGSYDFAFVDADKGNYLAYYERCLTLLRSGGLLAIDNVLWGGSVADPADQRATTLAIRSLNEHIAADERVSISLVPIGDGLFLVRKR